jgi:hypothetical protein
MRPSLTLSAGLCAMLCAGALFAPSSLAEAQTAQRDGARTGKADAGRVGHEGGGHEEGLRPAAPSPAHEPPGKATATTATPEASPTPEEESPEAFERGGERGGEGVVKDEGDGGQRPDESGITLAPGEVLDDAPREELRRRGFRWKSATEQALLFLAVQHGYAFTQPKTRRDLHGPFFRDYFRSVGSLSKWADGGRFFTNYVAHPMQGSLLGFVYVQNDPRAASARFGRDGAYWRSRLKAVAWSAAWSTQFEIGPVSQASIGNVGLHGKQTWIDIVITPTGGAVWLVAEDALDRFVVRRIEARTDNLLVKIAARMLLNPTRSSANLLRFRKPWYRERPSP